MPLPDSFIPLKEGEEPPEEEDPGFIPDEQDDEPDVPQPGPTGPGGLIPAPESDDEEQLETVLALYDESLRNYKRIVSRSQIVRQNPNFSGVAGPIYADSQETTTNIQTGTPSDTEGY